MAMTANLSVMTTITTKIKEMKSPSKSFHVLEFKEDEELQEMTVKRIAPMCESPHDLNTENYVEKTLESSTIMPNDFDNGDQATEAKSNVESEIIVSNMEFGSSPGASPQLEDFSNNAFPVSSCNVNSVCLGSHAFISMTERSPSDVSNNNASTDGPSSENCFGGGDSDGERVEIFFYADYIDYRGKQCTASVVSFSQSCVEAQSITIDGDETFHIHLEIEDIVKIESQWSAQFEAGTINIYFISKDAAQVEVDTIHSTSGPQEMKFPIVESNWYRKREAIESLDDRYKAIWNVLVDTGMERCSSYPEREDWMLTRSYFPNFDRSFKEVIYPKGDPDAVSISKRDIDLLLPDTFVNDTIIDFYIKYLKTKQNMDERTKFHFFNSFFFRKLADMDKDPSSAFDGKATFQRVRKWTKKVNLLEKDFILIPVNYNLHWSLIVICYFGEVVSYEDGDGVSGRVPCILHMDSLRGTHSGLKDLIQSYLWEEWKERQKGPYEDLYSKFRNLKFIPLELPQQQNSFDCGLFLLHYVELFLEEVPANFSICKITSSSKFLEADWFPPAEPSLKRTHIESLISGLLDNKSGECPPSVGNGIHCSPKELNSARSFDNDIQFTVKSSPVGGCHQSSLCQDGQGIEMTLLPASSARSTRCTRTSGLILKDLFKQASAPESFNNAPWGALENIASPYDFKSPAPPIEEEVKGSDCLVTTELAKHVFQHPDGVTPEAPVFPHSSEDYSSEAVYQPTSIDVDSTPVISGTLHNGEGSLPLVDISDPTNDSFFMTNLSGLGDEAKQLQNHAMSDEFDAVGPAFLYGDKLNAKECQDVDRFDYQQDNCRVGQEGASDWDELRSPKRKRIDGEGEEELPDNLVQDLNL